MGPFVLGVLVGWLAEWLFYTFWVKEGENCGDCSSLKAELEAKNRQIDSLRTQLGASAKTTNTSTNTSAQAAKSKKVDDSKSTSNKVSAAKKPVTTKKSAPKTGAKKATKKPAKKVKAGGDDFTKLTGIGPSMAATLKSLGIDTYAKLAETDDDILRDMLEESGARMNNNKEAMDSWNEQALVAAKGDFSALKKMQEVLKN